MLPDIALYCSEDSEASTHLKAGHVENDDLEGGNHCERQATRLAHSGKVFG